MDLLKLSKLMNELKVDFDEEKQEYYFLGCSIKIIDDDSYLCSFKELEDQLYSISEEIGYEGYHEWRKNANIRRRHNSGLLYIMDKELLDKIESIVNQEIKSRITKNSLIKSCIYGELLKKGYDFDFKLTDFNVRGKNGDLTPDYAKVVDVKWEYFASKFFNEIKFPLFCNSSDQLEGEWTVEDSVIDDYVTLTGSSFNKLINLIIAVFGKESKEYHELIEILHSFNVGLSDGFYSAITDSQEHLITQMFEHAIDKYEKAYGMYISKNMKLNFSMKQAYNVLPEELKKQLAEDIFYGDSLDSKLINDIIEIFKIHCKTKDNKSLNKKDIILFLTDISMKQVPNLMPEDLEIREDDYSDNKIISKYEEMYEQQKINDGRQRH